VIAGSTLKERVGFSEADFRGIFEAMLLREKLQEAMGQEVPTIADFEDWLEEQRRSEAVERYWSLEKLNEGLIQTYLSKGQTYLSENDLEHAEEAYAKALELNPNIVQAHSALGYIYALQGKLQEALEENLKVLELAPSDYATHKNLAMICQQLGRIEEAIAEAEIALELAPQSDRPALEAFIAQLREQISP